MTDNGDDDVMMIYMSLASSFIEAMDLEGACYYTNSSVACHSMCGAALV